MTDDATVYTALKNFLNVLSQLKQKCLPVICDEGVFRILAQIVLQRPIEFQNILPMLGCFHLTKAVEHCLGKLLKGSGIEDLLVSTNCFGIKIMEQVLVGTHYVRSLRGFMIIYESLRIFETYEFACPPKNFVLMELNADAQCCSLLYYSYIRNRNSN